MYRKAQSAMEYLMTYGWAILVILIALGAMFYLGVFDASTPNNCQIQAPFNCLDVLLVGVAGEDPGTLTLSIGVSSASSPTVSSITINGNACTPIMVGGILETSLTLNQVNIVSCSNGDLTAGDKFTGTIALTYTSQYGGLDHSVEGTFSGTVE